MEFTKAAAWISTALAVIVGIEVTHSAWCLWACLFTLLMSLEKMMDEVLNCKKYKEK